MTRPPPNHQAAGFTLIEILVGVALLALLFVSLTAVVARSAQASRTSSVQSMSNTSITKIGEQLGDELSSGTNILHRASTTTLDLYRLGERIPLQQPPGADRFGKKTVTFLGTPLAALVGQPVIITNNRGKYVSTRVISSAPSGVNSAVTLSCNLSLEGNLTAYPYKTLSFDGTSHLTRIENGTSSAVAQNVKYVKFEPMYGQSAGQFPSSSGTPAMQQGGQSLTMINYGVVGQDDPPVTSIGSARINLAALNPVDCDENPVSPANNLGKLQVNVLLDGAPTAPAGLNPNVSVSGPQPLSTITTFDTRVYERVTAGSYTANAPVITSGTTIYDPTVTNNPGTVGNGRQATINVNYKVRKGKVQLQITGLPSPPPGSGTVTLSGPDPKSIPAANGTTPLELTPGTYTVTATNVGGYIPTVSQPNLNVTSSTNTTVTITYTDPKALLTLRVNGLPSSTSATLTASGPETQNISVPTSSYTVAALKKGNYTITAPTMTLYGVTYSPNPATATISLGEGGTTHTVTYSSGPVSPLPPTPSTPTPPISPLVPTGKIRFKIGGTPPSGTYSAASYELHNGKLKFLGQQSLNEYTSYDLPDNYYYIVTLMAPGSSEIVSRECDTPNEPFGSCNTAKPGDKTVTQTQTREIGWSVASDNQPGNVASQANTQQSILAYQYKTGSTTNFFGSACKTLITETKTGDFGGKQNKSETKVAEGCSAYNPINISAAEVQALMDAIDRAIPLASNLNTWKFVDTYNEFPTYVPLSSSFTVSGLNAAQQVLFNKMSYYVDGRPGSYSLHVQGCSPDTFKNCPAVWYRGK